MERPRSASAVGGGGKLHLAGSHLTACTCVSSCRTAGRRNSSSPSAKRSLAAGPAGLAGPESAAAKPAGAAIAPLGQCRRKACREEDDDDSGQEVPRGGSREARAGLRAGARTLARTSAGEKRERDTQAELPVSKRFS